MSERRAEGFVWASTGRIRAAAKVRGRWSGLRGTLLASGTLGLAQAVVIALAALALDEAGISLLWLIPLVALSTLALVAWMGLVRAPAAPADGVGQAPAAKVLEVLEAARPSLRTGLDAQSAQILAFEATSRLGYAAVAVTDRTGVLAHVGLGADHHGAGRPAPPGALSAMADRRVTRLPVGWKHGCDGRDCPLKSAVVAPVLVRGEPIGSLVLFSEGALAVSDRDRAIASHLGELVSTEISVGELDLHARATANAELAALQAQIEPHFLFNALNTIAAFCRTRPDEARELVLAFADYCRWTLQRPAAFVDLAEELVHVEAYLALERARFGDSLDVEVRIAPSASTVPVPPFLVQPLVENAIKHGKGDRPLRVVVRAEVRLGRLRVTVRDNGRGIPKEIADSITVAGVGSGAAGLGLASVAQRIAAFYGEEGRLRVVSAPRLGTLVSIVLPTVPVAAPAAERAG
jgi:two-component system sensor histidine kinase LytS